MITTRFLPHISQTTSALGLVFVLASLGRAELPYQIDWVRTFPAYVLNETDEIQFSSDFPSGVSADGLGNVYFYGSTYGTFSEPFVASSYDTFLGKLDSQGNLLWLQQSFNPENDYGYASQSGVAADANGNVFTAGNIETLPEFVNIKRYDASTGDLIWTRGLDIFTQATYPSQVSTDGLGNAYLGGVFSGRTTWEGPEGFLSKFDPAGNNQWTLRLGSGELETVDDHVSGVSADSLGNVFASGYAGGSFGGPGVGPFFAKYNSLGEQIWLRKGAGEADSIISTDGNGNAYAFASTASGRFLNKYTSSGDLAWSSAVGWGGSVVSTDPLGNIYADRRLPTPDNQPGPLELVKFDSLGNQLWAQSLGDVMESIWSLSAQEGAIYLQGKVLFSTAVVRLSSPVPEPSSLLLGLFGGIGLWRWRRMSS